MIHVDIKRFLPQSLWARVACAVSLVLFLALLAGGIVINRLTVPLHHTEKPALYILPTDDLNSVWRKIDSLFPLSQKQLSSTKLLARMKGYGNRVPLRTGYYDLSGINGWQLVQRLSAGNQTPVRVTFNNIRLKEELAASLSRQMMADSAQFMQLFSDSVACSRWGFSTTDLLAMFIPDTYEVYWNWSPERWMERMKKEYDRFWNAERKQLADSLGMSLIEVSILASIVEEESKDRVEQPIVAGLYINRLRRNMPLQADPTVKYSMLDFSLTRILSEHLKVDSPYNTYLHIGLPPGPIRMPSKQAIEAVLRYAKHSYLYMCAKEDFSGRHNFASTLAEHNRNASRYRQELNRRKIFR